MPGTPPRTCVIDAAQLEKGYRRFEGATVVPHRFHVVEELTDGRYRVLDPGPSAVLGDWPPGPFDAGWVEYVTGQVTGESK